MRKGIQLISKTDRATKTEYETWHKDAGRRGDM